MFGQSLTLDDVSALGKQAHYLSAVSAGVSSKGQTINGALNWPTSIQGVSPSYLDIRDWPIKDGISFSDEEVTAGPPSCPIHPSFSSSWYAP